MTNDRYYQDIGRVQVLEDIGAVNDALANGWTILRIPDVSTQTMEGSKVYVVSRPQFILGWSGLLPETSPAERARHEKGPQKERADKGTQKPINDVEKRLEGLPWLEAASKKCDFVQNVPADLVENVRAAKGGVKGTTHHFTAPETELTLFRFKRGAP